MQSPPDDYPITGLCVVSDPQRCPPGYELIYKSYDRNEDCDLWKDSFFRTKVTRYLCVTRVFPLEGDREYDWSVNSNRTLQGRLNNVLGDIVMNNERDVPPNGYSVIEETVDTREKATRKKQLCVKMLPRDSTNDAICELIVLSKSKRAPVGYTLIGEMNGLTICFKMGKVPPQTQAQQPAEASMPPSYMSRPPTYSMDTQSNSAAAPYALNPASAAPISNVTQTGASLQRSNRLTRQDSAASPTSPLSGVPFQLSTMYQGVQSLKSMSVPQVNYRSLVDIENQYNYEFRLERSAAARLRPEAVE